MNYFFKADLWCDGTVDCPGGWDEQEERCGIGLAPVKLLLVLAVLCVIILIATAIVLITRLRKYIFLNEITK